MEGSRKIGIFGGTFDPFHVAHAVLIQKALDFGLDRLIIVPTTCNYYRDDKRCLFSFDERCLIIEEFLTGIAGDVIISTIERDQDSKWRTINTVEYFRKKFSEDTLYFILGEDSYNNFKTWFRYDDILANCKLLVANRGKNFHLVDDLPAEILDMGNTFIDTSSTKVRQKLIEEMIDMYMNDKEYYGRN